MVEEDGEKSMGDVVGGRQGQVASSGAFGSQPRVLSSLTGQGLDH